MPCLSGKGSRLAVAKSCSEFQVNAATTNNPAGNDVARLSDGGFVVTWWDPVPSNGGGRVVARHYDANGNASRRRDRDRQQGERRLLSNTVVSALAGGAYVVSWTDNDAADQQCLRAGDGGERRPRSAQPSM
jgi:hypothetical protein